MKIVLASWGDRFLAWIIDSILVSSLVNLTPINLLYSDYFSSVSVNTVIFLAYWTLMESINGQSVGKMVLRLRVVTENGKKINFVEALIESLGKAIILPLDCIIGWIGFNDKRQRLFNKLSKTIVIKEKEKISNKYIKEKD